MCGSRGGTGGPPPLKNHKTLGVLSNSGRDPLKNYEATESALNVGPHYQILCDLNRYEPSFFSQGTNSYF